MLIGSRRALVSAGGFMPQTKAILGAFQSQATRARATMIDNTVAAITSAGLWPIVDVMYFIGVDAQSSAINWKSPGNFTLQQILTVAFAADRGWTSDGTGYFNSTWAPSTFGGAYSQNSAHIGAFITSNVASAAQDIAINPGSFTVVASFNSRNATNFMRGGINNITAFNDSTNTILDSTGHSVLNRSGLNVTNAYRSGVSLGITDATASTGVAAGTLFVCSNPTAGALSPRRIGGAHAGGSMTAAQWSAFYAAAFNNYFHPIGAL